MWFAKYILYLLSIVLVFIIVVLPITYVLVRFDSSMFLIGVPLAVCVVMMVKPGIGSKIYRYDDSVHKSTDKFDDYILFGALILLCSCLPFVFRTYGSEPTIDEAFERAVGITLLFSFYLVCCAVALQLLRCLISYFKNRRNG